MNHMSPCLLSIQQLTVAAVCFLAQTASHCQAQQKLLEAKEDLDLEAGVFVSIGREGWKGFGPREVCLFWSALECL